MTRCKIKDLWKGN